VPFHLTRSERGRWAAMLSVGAPWSGGGLGREEAARPYGLEETSVHKAGCYRHDVDGR